MEPQSAGSPTSPSSPGTSSSESTKLPTPYEEMPPSEEAALKPGRQSSSSSSSSSSSEGESLFHLDAAELSSPLVATPDNDHASSGDGAEVKPEPDDWAPWPEQPTYTVEDPFLPDGSTVFTEMTQAPEVQSMPKPAEATAAADNGFDPERIPASVFQTKSSSQAEWSVASNESLFSIHGTSQSGDLGGLYSSSRSHFDYFYDEAMAMSGGAEPDWKLPTVAEGSEPADAFDAVGGHGAKEFAMPGSARSDASGGSARAEKAVAFRRHESGSGGSSSNFSFAFPILAETSPKKKECTGGGGGALYQPLQKECEQPPPLPAPTSAFEEMTTEEERRRTGWCWCGDCCGCCWFGCSWSSCCCCCYQWRWWCCDCPSLCRCNWCLCF